MLMWVAIQGPSGQKLSKPFARVHCPSAFCRSRQVTSFGHALGRDAAADPSDHDGELALVVEVLGLGRVHDRLERTDHGGVRLEEQQRVLRHRIAQFRCVLGVVAPDPNDLAARNDR